PGGQVLRLAARWAGPGEGAKLAADINGGRPPVAGFVAPAHYASSLGWLFQAFPADLKLPSLPTATAASAMAPVLERAFGGALHDFHETPATVGSVLDRGTDLAKLAENAGDFAWLLPGERARIDALHRRLIAALEASAPAEGRLVHGDFHGDNVLVDGERLGLIDFEDCALGDAAEDVALN